MLRAKGVDRLFIVSDSTALAGQPPGRYATPVGGQVDVGADGRLSFVGTDLLAGAGVDLAHGLRHLSPISASTGLGARPCDGHPRPRRRRRRASAVAAWPVGRLQPGHRADLVLLAPDGPDRGARRGRGGGRHTGGQPGVTEPAYPLRAGAAAAAVDVPIGTPLSGYAAREGGATGTHDPCTARALAVEDTCWVAVDVCGLDRATCASVAERVGLPDGHLLVTATHTHSGPACTPGRLGGDDPVARQRVVDAAVGAATQALAARRPVRLWWSSVRGAGVAVDRRTPSRPVDPPIDLLRLVAEDGAVVGWLVSYPCHPVVLAADNRLVSADYVWALRAELEGQAPGSVAVFLPGTCGDLNNGHAAEASYTSAPLAGRTFAEAERIGRHLARTRAGRSGDRARHRRCRGGPPGDGRARAGRRSTRSRPATLAERWAAELRRTPSRAARRSCARGSTGPASGRRPTRPRTPRGSPPCAGAGSGWSGLPGEPFLSFAEALRRRVDGPVLVTGYTGDCPGYLPDAEAYAHGGYEVTDAHRYYGMPAPFARGSAERLLEVAVELVSAP